MDSNFVDSFITAVVYRLPYEVRTLLINDGWVVDDQAERAVHHCFIDPIAHLFVLGIHEQMSLVHQCVYTFMHVYFFNTLFARSYSIRTLSYKAWCVYLYMSKVYIGLTKAS